MKDKTHKRWCSKHQVVHGEGRDYWSCSYPNDKAATEKKKTWRKDPKSTEDYYLTEGKDSPPNADRMGKK